MTTATSIDVEWTQIFQAFFKQTKSSVGENTPDLVLDGQI